LYQLFLPPHFSTLVLCTAIVVIVVTSLLQGCGTEVLVNLLNIPTNVTVEDNENRKVTELLYACDHLPVFFYNL
jgi:hypothetical protein